VGSGGAGCSFAGVVDEVVGGVGDGVLILMLWL